MPRCKIVVVIERDDDVLEEDNENAGDMKLYDCELEQSDGGHGGRQLTRSDVFILKQNILKHKLMHNQRFSYEWMTKIRDSRVFIDKNSNEVKSCAVMAWFSTPGDKKNDKPGLSYAKLKLLFVTFGEIKSDDFEVQ